MFGIDNFNKPIVDFSSFDISQLGDALLFGGAILLIGMITIFTVLCLLWICLIVFKFVFQGIDNKKGAKNNTNATAGTDESAINAGSNDDAEIVAVIAAAIAMAESESSDMKFKVVSFKRV
jgi:sodium pump decarboxylase gamma subunit